MSTQLTNKWQSHSRKFPFLSGGGAKPSRALALHWSKLKKHDTKVRTLAYKCDNLWAEMKTAGDPKKVYKKLTVATDELRKELDSHVKSANKAVAAAKKRGKGQDVTLGRELELLLKAQSYVEAQTDSKKTKALLSDSESLASKDEGMRTWGLTQRAVAPLRDMQAIVAGLKKAPELSDYNGRLLPALRKFAGRVDKAGAAPKFRRSAEFKELAKVIKQSSQVLKPAKTEEQLERFAKTAEGFTTLLNQRLNKYAAMVQKTR